MFATPIRSRSARWQRGARTLLPACTVAVCLGLAGCASPVARSVVTANLAQEEAANQLLLLNIARAHEHMPMHFSQIGQIRTGPGGWGLGLPSIGLEVPFGGGSANSPYTLTAGMDGQSPVDVTALASQEFIRGMTTPVTPDLLALFTNQGWPFAMLVHLFFESVDLPPAAKDGPPVRLLNNPGARNFIAFRRFADQLAACELVLDATKSASAVLSSPVAEVSVRDGVRVKEAKLSLHPVKLPNGANGYQLAAVDKEAVFKVQAAKRQGGKPDPCPGAPVDSLKLMPGRPAAADEDDKQAQIVLRSPEAALYYLGQLSRAQTEKWYGNSPHDDRNLGPLLIAVPEGHAALFRMSKHGDVPKPALSVTYAGHTFDVPKFDGSPESKPQDRSVKVLALMHLLLGLQEKGKEPPSASSVRLVR